MPKSTPNYLSVDALGQIVASFSGGLVLPIALNAPGTASTAVTWTKTEDGAMVARVQASRQSLSPPARNFLSARLDSPDAARNAQLQMTAATGNVLAPGGIPSHKAWVLALAGAETRLLLDDNGYSDFFQGGGLVAFEVFGGSSVSLNAPRAFNNIVGVFRSTGFAPVAGGPFPMQVNLSTVGLIAQSQFYFNTANEHTTLIAFANSRNFASMGPGYTLSLSFPSGLTFDANDMFGGFVAVW